MGAWRSMGVLVLYANRRHLDSQGEEIFRPKVGGTLQGTLAWSKWMLWTLEVTDWYSETGQPGTLVSMLTEVNISAAKCIDVLYITSNLSFLDMMFFFILSYRTFKWSDYHRRWQLIFCKTNNQLISKTLNKTWVTAIKAFLILQANWELIKKNALITIMVELCQTLKEFTET